MCSNCPESDSPEILSFSIPPEGIDRLDSWLAAQCDGFSRARIQGLLKAGRVSVNGAPVARATARVSPGDSVSVSVPPPVPADPEPEDIPLDILFEDPDILVLHKPAGLVVHPAPGHLSGTLVNALLHHCPSLTGIGGVARPGIVHRLDQDTSGVMIVAKSQRAMDVLTREFASHSSIRKTYLAVAHGIPVPAEGYIESLIGRCPFDRKKMAVVSRNGKIAKTRYRTLASATPPNAMRPLSLIQCEIATGRTHQIRVHLSSELDCPIAGDSVYGRQGWDKRLSPVPSRQLLHAWRLELDHPVSGSPMLFEAPIPQDFPLTP